MHQASEEQRLEASVTTLFSNETSFNHYEGNETCTHIGNPQYHRKLKFPAFDFSYWKIVVHTNAFLHNKEEEKQIMESYSTGLKVENITTGQKYDEIVLNPMPLEEGHNQYLLATDFVGEFYVKFFIRVHKSVDIELDTFDYIYK